LDGGGTPEFASRATSREPVSSILRALELQFQGTVLNAGYSRCTNTRRTSLRARRGCVDGVGSIATVLGLALIILLNVLRGPMAGLLILRRLILALLTQLVCPAFYPGYLGHHGHAMIIISTVVTTMRNLALVAFTVEVCWLAWRILGAGVMDRTALMRRGD
jgi:hypothetical protein